MRGYEKKRDLTPAEQAELRIPMRGYEYVNESL